MKTIRISDLGEIITGHTPPTKQRDYYGDVYPLLKPTDMNLGERYSPPTAESVSEKWVALKQKTLIPRHATCVVTIGTIGKICITSKPCFTNQAVNAVIPDRSRFDEMYTYYLLKTVVPHVKHLSSGTASGRENVSKGVFSSIEVSVHNLPTQRKIASILSAYDDLIENNTRRIAILEEMAQAIYREWFVNFRFPGHENLKLVDSPLGQIPEGWGVAPLNEVAEITMGTSPKSSTYNDEGNGTPLVNGPVEFGDKFTQRIKWTTDPKRFCEAGNLVVCVRGSTTGKYVKSDGVYCLGRGVCGIRGEYQSFVDQLFAQQLPSLLSQTGGSTFPSWTGPQLKSHPVLSPPPELVAQFDEHVSPKQQAVYVYSRKNECLRNTRDLLLPKLISGKLDVEDLDIDVGMNTEQLEEMTA